MPLPNKTWTTSYPTSQDTVGVEQGNLTNDTSPGALDGHRTLVEHLHALRDKLQAVAEYVGDASNLPTGSLREFLNLMSAKGDLLTRNASGRVRLPIGTDTHVLTADSSEASGMKWAAAAGGASPLTTKGDIYTYDTGNQRLPVGADGTVLTADSAEATGNKWASFLTGIDYVQFDTTFSGSTAEGRLQWNSSDGTLDVGMPGGTVNLQLGQELHVRAKNSTGSQIDNGKVVYISGASGQRPEITLADNSAPATSAKTIGMATEDIGNGQNGYVAINGLVRGLNTGSFTDGDELWLGTSGDVVNVQPTAPTCIISMGYCVYSHATDGIILVSIRKHMKISEASDVNVSGIADGEVLAWSVSNSRFENTAPSGGGSTPHEKEYATTGAETPGATVTFGPLTGTPRGGGTADTPTGYDILVFRNGKKMKYSATPATYDEYFYDTINNEIDVLASGDADDYEVVYGS